MKMLLISVSTKRDGDQYRIKNVGSRKLAKTHFIKWESYI